MVCDWAISIDGYGYSSGRPAALSLSSEKSVNVQAATEILLTSTAEGSIVKDSVQ